MHFVCNAAGPLTAAAQLVDKDRVLKIDSL
jgi:hypothetical protein